MEEGEFILLVGLYVTSKDVTVKKYISQSIALAVSTVFFATAAAAITIEKPPVIDRESALNPSYKSAQEIINDRGFQREAGANDDSAGTRNGYLNNPTRPSTGGAPNVSIAAINCKHAAYKTLCAEIDAKIKAALGSGSGGNENAGGWKTIYNGAGTRSIDPPDGYSQYKVWYKYTASKEYGSEVKTLTNQALIGQPTNAVATVSVTRGGKCGGDRESITATASARVTIVPTNKFTVAASAYDKVTKSYRCVTATAEARVSNLVITRFDAFY